MNAKRFPASYPAALALLVVAALAARATEPETPQAPTIHDGDVPIGPLGYPMGTYLTIECTTVDQVALREGTLVKVDTVSGQRLAQPRWVWVRNLHGLRDGTRCLFKGYEEGTMIGVPPGREQADREAGRQPMMVQFPYSFQWNFVAASIVSPRGIKLGDELPTPSSDERYFPASKR